jgi:hypothetical protein
VINVEIQAKKRRMARGRESFGVFGFKNPLKSQQKERPCNIIENMLHAVLLQRQ